MVAAIDIAGQRFGKLTAIERIGTYRNRAAKWLLHCDCGGHTVSHPGSLRAGQRTGCRECSRATHSMHDTRLHRVWTAMKQRCTNPKHVAFSRYGGRGIVVCQEWMAFEPFAAWALINGYRDDLQIDRIDNDLGYSPENCRFVTAAENMANRRCSRPLEHSLL